MSADLGPLLDLAIEQARLAESAGEVPVGALLIDASGEVIARGFNQPVSSGDPTAHAEVVVLREAARRRANYRLPDTTLVVTVEPCLMCAGAMLNARVARLVYGAPEPKWGAFGSILAVQNLRLSHRIEVVSGVRGEECGEIMRRFFRGRRG